jgi:hypothetical protein
VINIEVQQCPDCEDNKEKDDSSKPPWHHSHDNDGIL